jgi:hypothetical protein
MADRVLGVVVQREVQLELARGGSPVFDRFLVRRGQIVVAEFEVVHDVERGPGLLHPDVTTTVSERTGTHAPARCDAGPRPQDGWKFTERVSVDHSERGPSG